jgi:valyl-tRNA synthetase
MTASWPSAVQYSADSAAEADVDWIKAFVLGIRQIRGEMDISPSRKLGVLIENASADDRRRLDSQSSYLARLAGLESLRELVAGEVAPPSALAVIGDMRAMVPMEGLIDPQAEVARLEKRAAKTRDEIQKARNKLANENFVRNAPPEVVTQEQGRVADFERTLASIDSQLQRVRALLK